MLPGGYNLLIAGEIHECFLEEVAVHHHSCSTWHCMNKGCKWNEGMIWYGPPLLHSLMGLLTSGTLPKIHDCIWFTVLGAQPSPLGKTPFLSTVHKKYLSSSGSHQHIPVFQPAMPEGHWMSKSHSVTCLNCVRTQASTLSDSYQTMSCMGTLISSTHNDGWHVAHHIPT